MCNGLTIPQSMREQLFDKLSGGEKTRVNLARLILEDTDILLLDEPTNHLDLRATEWLEEYLDKFKGTVLTVSHDRYFLDKVVNRIVEIQAERRSSTPATTASTWWRRSAGMRRSSASTRRSRPKLSSWRRPPSRCASGPTPAWTRPSSGSSPWRSVSSACAPPTAPPRSGRWRVRFGEREFRGDEVLTIKGLTKSFGDRTLFSNLGLEVVGGERIALLGDNGSGKTTLLKILLGEEEPDAGKSAWDRR